MQACTLNSLWCLKKEILSSRSKDTEDQNLKTYRLKVALKRYRKVTFELAKNYIWISQHFQTLKKIFNYKKNISHHLKSCLFFNVWHRKWYDLNKISICKEKWIYYANPKWRKSRIGWRQLLIIQMNFNGENLLYVGWDSNGFLYWKVTETAQSLTTIIMCLS